MKISDLFLMIFSNLNRTKLRTFLCCLGVMIGTVGILLTVSLGFGMEKGVIDSLSQMGSVKDITIERFKADALDWSSSSERSKARKIKLNQKLISQIEKWENVEKVNPYISLSGEMEAGKSNKKSDTKGSAGSVNFVNISNFVSDLKISKGEELKEGQKNTVVIGTKVAENLLKKISKEKKVPKEKVDLIGQKVIITVEKSTGEIKTQKLKIAGILSEGQGFEKDFNVYLPLDQAIDLKEWQESKVNSVLKEGYDRLIVTIASVDKVSEVQNKLKDIGLLTYSNKQILDSIEKSFIFIKIILFGIGGVALIVASVGILNTMMMAVYERTREIGIMKAVGASNKEVITLFLGEGGAIGIIGGISGVAMSFLGIILINFLVRYYLLSQGTPASDISSQILFLPSWLVIFGVSFSFFIGLFASTYPALFAARLRVLETLRHE